MDVLARLWLSFEEEFAMGEETLLGGRLTTSAGVEAGFEVGELFVGFELVRLNVGEGVALAVRWGPELEWGVASIAN
jgi:hypothetical protein